MKKLMYCLFILWAILSICALVFWGNIWVGTSFLWFPAAWFITQNAYIFIISDIGAAIKRNKEKKMVRTCDNCLFASTADLINAGKEEGERVKCLGEKVFGAKRGVVCEHHTWK